ncbi:hypothetical protein RND81_09G183500 [Saponaria officinalis]|uniref:WD repeat-containing protein 75 second beta-propeller domain-containing protein n=1 Tax=Saponaria officinalis TaxID=3572 RepID=A0AAW1IMF7_SAPOF
MIHGGRSYVSSAPAVSNDAKRVLLCTGNTVSIFSLSTALLINELEGHQALVTSVVVLPNKNKLIHYCWTSSLDGTIRLWDFLGLALMQTVDIKLPVFSMVIPSVLSTQEVKDSKRVNVFAYICVEDISDPGDKPKPLPFQIRKCNLTMSKLVRGFVLKETEQPEFLTSSPSGEFLGMHIRRTLHIWSVPSLESKDPTTKKVRLHHTKNYTCVAFHPNKSIVAAGDITGRILVWRGVGRRTFPVSDWKTKGSLKNKREEERPGVRGDDDAESCTTWHWHSSEVKFLSFSSDGAHLYSGGYEGVLVLWHLDTGKKNFLPSIASPLLYFVHTPDPTLSVISCADNQVHILKMTSLEILKTISGIKLPSSFPEMWNGATSGFYFDRSAGLVALPTENYRIQFYSLFDDREVSEVQVCQRNFHPSDDITVVVSLVALSPDGSMMTTVETRVPEAGVGGLICLKFWVSESQKKDFDLSTVVYEPHRDSAISAVAFRPGCKMVVSSSYGGDFKIWVDNGTSKSNRNSGWVCHSVGSYKGQPMTAAAFSADGSVLAVAAETMITLWDPDRNYLVGVMGETQTPISNLSFVGKSEYVVSSSQGSRPQLSLWCSSKLIKSWSYNLSIEAIACMENDPCFAVLTLLPASGSADISSYVPDDGVILLFDVSSPVPVATWLARKGKDGGLAFVQPNQMEENSDGKLPSALLAYINSDHEYLIFDPLRKEQHEISLSRKKEIMDLEETGRSGYASIFGELAEFVPKKTSQAPIVVASERPWETIFSGPSHTLPPLTKLCSDFLESLLEKRDAAKS